MHNKHIISLCVLLFPIDEQAVAENMTIAMAISNSSIFFILFFAFFSRCLRFWLFRLQWSSLDGFFHNPLPADHPCLTVRKTRDIFIDCGKALYLRFFAPVRGNNPTVNSRHHVTNYTWSFHCSWLNQTYQKKPAKNPGQRLLKIDNLFYLK